MKNSKLLDVLHMILHLADAAESLTSEQLAQTAGTNAVVVRRIMAGLRERGLVASEKGHGGGWRLICDIDSTTLKDVYDAVGAPRLFAVGCRDNSPRCLVAKAVNETTLGVFDRAEKQILDQFSEVTLSELKNSVARKDNKEK